MDAQARLTMNVSGWAKRLTRSGWTIAAWLVVMGLYFVALVPAVPPR
jgi:hypothetical protein